MRSNPTCSWGQEEGKEVGMKIERQQIDTCTVVVLDGRLDAHEVTAVRKTLEQALVESQGRVAVNLAQVNFIDSSGLATLVQSMKRCREQNGDLILYALQQPVRIIFELTRLDKAFAIYETESIALSTLKRI